MTECGAMGHGGDVVIHFSIAVDLMRILLNTWLNMQTM